MFSSIVLATDGSDHAKHALDIGIDMATKYGAKLTLVHVLTHDHPPAEMERMVDAEHMAEPESPQIHNLSLLAMTMSRYISGEDYEAKQIRVVIALGEHILKSASKKARNAGVKEIITEIRSGDYANCILDVADKADADIIVMGRRGLSELQGFMTGSVSHKVSQRANCSVLTIK